MKLSATHELLVMFKNYFKISLNLIKLALLTASLLSFGVIAQAPTDVRIALIIGNAAYVNVPALANSTNDAASMANIMRKLGFKVILVTNADKSTMERAIDQMKDQLKGQQAVAMLYYAGHGIQLDWHNYMVPIDVKLSSSSDVRKQTIDIERVINSFKISSTRLNIIVLDACRDNPFTDKASGKGLAQLDAPPGTYLAFATAPGNVAEDGDESSGNGLFTQYLIKELQKPARIEDVFKRVRLQVRKKSQGRQIPWDSSSLEDDFAFNDGSKHTFNQEDLLTEGKEKEARLRLENGLEKSQDNPRVLEDAKLAESQRLREVEKTKLQVELEARLRKESAEKQFEIQKAEWDKIKNSKNVDDFYAFLEKYPSGFITEQAQYAIESLSSTKVLPQISKLGEQILENKTRFRVGDSQVVRVTDLNTNKVQWSGELKVEQIEGNRVYVKSGNKSSAEIYTLDGGIIKGGATENTYSWDPPRIDLPGDELVVGKKWVARTIETDEKNRKELIREDKTSIVAYEDVTVPAGTFKAYKIVMNSKYNNGTTLTRTYWVEPGWGFNLKIIRDVKRSNGFDQLQSIEMMSRVKGS